MRIFLAFLILFSSASLFAQNSFVYGTCISKNGKGIENIRIRISSDSMQVFFTEYQGVFKIQIPSDQDLEITFDYNDLRIVKKVNVKPDENKFLGEIVFNILIEESITVRANEKDALTLAPLQLGGVITSDVGRTLAYTTAASSNNELTSNYTVRGGNYDENLVYVNGFQVNRPFLTRSGQQEGLNFINTALVKEIRFSAGGFDSNYGDKLSSVLDIDYLKPDSLNASLMASLLGVEASVMQEVSPRLNYLFGARYRANGYLLNSLPTKGNYNPVFWDVQSLINYNITEKLVWSTLAHFSSNDYRFSPQTAETDFGTVNEAYRLMIYFDGQEQSRFQTLTGGTALKWAKNKKTQLDLYASVFNTDERENFDIQGQYFINLLETNPGKENFGDSIGTTGIGTFLNHARNGLKATIYNVYHNGSYSFNDIEKYKTKNEILLKQRITWGANFQVDNFVDKLSEWKMVDSAGFSLPQMPSSNQIQLQEVIKGNLKLNTQRYSGYFQYSVDNNKYKDKYPVTVRRTYVDENGKKYRGEYTDTLPRSVQRLVANIGFRTGYTEVNDEIYITPRASINFHPRSFYYKNGRIVRRNTVLRLATGMYYQPPFYRELRTFSGTLNTHVKSQKSVHLVAGGEFNFDMWERDVPFKFTAEAYYKYLWDVNPYEVDNVRTRYYANNDAVAYAYGIDLNIHGEFVPGVQSFFKVGFLSTKEDIKNDYYKEYFNAAGEKIIFGYTNDETPVDSTTIFPGYIPRPTDQLMNFAILFQDNMPGFESLSAQLGMLFGTRLPYGPPDFDRYKDTLRQKSYFRVDLGISYDFLHDKKIAEPHGKRWLTDAILSFEVFNLLGVNNVLSKQWIQDVSGKYYAIPNYLTQRRFNLKLTLRI
jgi:hypothetical protein